MKLLSILALVLILSLTSIISFHIKTDFTMQQKEKVDNNSKHALIFKNGKENATDDLNDEVSRDEEIKQEVDNSNSWCNPRIATEEPSISNEDRNSEVISPTPTQHEISYIKLKTGNRTIYPDQVIPFHTD